MEGGLCVTQFPLITSAMASIGPPAFPKRPGLFLMGPCDNSVISVITLTETRGTQVLKLSIISELGREDGGRFHQAKPHEGPPSSNLAARPPFRFLDTFEYSVGVPEKGESVEKHVLDLPRPLSQCSHCPREWFPS